MAKRVVLLRRSPRRHPPQFRLRIGVWRYIFRKSGEDAIEIVRVRNRREACR